MKEYPQAVTKLIDALKTFPGVGEKSAERYALFILKQDRAFSDNLASAIAAARAKTRYCTRCFNLTDAELCAVCADAGRDQGRICVVESPREVLTIERSGAWKGVYHCLLGRLAPSEGIGEGDLTIAHLRKRCIATKPTEVVIATNPDLGGDATALAVARALSDIGVTVSRLARGVPVGYQLDILGGNVLEEAFEGRQAILRQTSPQRAMAAPSAPSVRAAPAAGSSQRPSVPAAAPSRGTQGGPGPRPPERGRRP